VSLQWFGDAVAVQAEVAALGGTVETVEAAVDDARANTPVLTGAARDSLRHEGTGLTMTWGYHVAHGLWVEIGAYGRAGASALRRAADVQYAQLGRRIAARFGRG
jgi:hypothetical protein